MKTIWHGLIGIFLGLLLAVGVWLMARTPRGESVTLGSPPTAELIQVNVTGAVKHPGLYDLDEKSRVADAVEAAGGLSSEADMSRINLAATIMNMQELEIPYAVEFALKESQNAKVVLEETPLPSLASEPSNKGAAVAREDIEIQTDPNPTVTATSTSTGSCSNGAIGSGVFVWPADNHSLSGDDFESGHPGIDIAAGKGSPVYAADAGIVTAMGDDESRYGNVIQIKHGNGYFTVYAHLSVIEVSMCQSVSAGQRIGAAGSTGNAQGAHLHFEVVLDGRSINPWLVLP